jgi:alanine dehydrogenase
MHPTTFLSDADVAAACDWVQLVGAIREAYSVPVDSRALPSRTMARADGAWLRTLSGAPQSSRYMGAKLIAASTRNSRASYLIALFDRETTELTALIDGNHVTTSRTAATSAAAADALAPHGPLRVSVIGSGLEARNHVLALGAIRELESVLIFSPTRANRERLAELVTSELDTDARAVQSAQQAVAETNVVIAAARSRDESPTVRGSWLAPGATVISIGSTLPEQHEVDVEVIRRADAIYADMPDEVASETGDMLDAKAAGIDFQKKLFSLQQLVAGTAPARRAADEILVYKSVGSALQDLAVAELCLSRARERGFGTVLPATIKPIDR